MPCLLPLALASFSLHAQEVDDSGLAFKMGTTPEGDTPAGFAVGTLNDDFSYWMLWGRGGDDDTRVQRWQISLGTHGPAIAVSSEEDKMSIGDTFLAAPYMVIGGNRYQDLRLGMDLGSDGLWNFLSYAKLDPKLAYIGPFVGLGTEVRYPTPDLGGAATGSLHLECGFAAGTVLADALHLRVYGSDRFDPFVQEMGRLDGNALVALSFLRWDVPLGVQVAGEVSQAKDAADPAWFVSGAFFIASRDNVDKVRPNDDDDDGEERLEL
jgi:hypothetical protein